MSYQQPPDMYHDHSSARSPGSQRHQQPLHRQPSRQFDAYGPMPVNLYDDPMARYDTARLERLNPSLHSNSYAYDLGGSQTWNPNGFANPQALGGIRSASSSLKTSTRGGRAGLPTTWLDQQPGIPSPFSSLGPSPLQSSSAIRTEPSASSEVDDELIPTAIVIKNIPFAVKKEQLVQLMTELNLPLPYAFNYHFDNGVFRGLAFANFTSAEETATVIEVLNHFELQGRKLRVEYKKMLPLQERERIEREKRERRGQLEEQHRPMPSSQLQTQSSMSSLTSHIPATSPSPVSQRGQKLDVDLNDTTTLSYYSQLLLFKEDTARDSVIFPANLTPVHRRTVHTLAHNMGLGHASRGSGEQRQVQVFKVMPGSNVSPPLSSIPAAVQPPDTARRGLNRAATIDFSESRTEAGANSSANANNGNGSSHPYGAGAAGAGGSLRGQASGFLGVLESPGNFGNAQNLRAAKSFADLRSYTPSPVPSSASFPAALQTNGAARVPQYDGAASGASNTPTLAGTPSGSSLGMQQRDDGLLVNSLSSLSLGTGIGGTNSSPRRLRGMFSWEQPDSQPSSAGPIGSNRSIGLGFDSQLQERMPIRQPRGPAPEKGPGFGGRQNGHQSRASDELRTNSGVEIIVE